jgi:hypothetical protein
MGRDTLHLADLHMASGPFSISIMSHKNLYPHKCWPFSSLPFLSIWGGAMGRPGRRERGATHPSDPTAVNWAATYQVNRYRAHRTPSPRHRPGPYIRFFRLLLRFSFFCWFFAVFLFFLFCVSFFSFYFSVKNSF